MEEPSNITTCCNVLVGSERALKGDGVSPLECHKLLEQVDGLFGVASDGRRSPSDFLYQFHRLIMPRARCFDGHRVEYVCPC